MMLQKLIYFLPVLLLSCTSAHQQKATKENPPITKEITKEIEESGEKGLKVQVRDKKPPAPLQKTIPPKALIEGFKKASALVADPKDIPQKFEQNTEYYRAEKVIDGKKRTVSVVFGNILSESDAIVNAANTELTGGDGIDGLIHDKAKVDGHDLMKDEAIEYKKFHHIGGHNEPSFAIGSAMVTNPYGLDKKIKMVVFTVGPDLRGSGPTPSLEQELELYSAIYNSMLKASQYDAKSISIPAVSGGIFAFPLNIAAELYFKAAFQFFVDHPNTSIEHVRFTNFDNPTVTKVAEAFVKLFP